MTRSRLLALGGSLLFSAVETKTAFARHPGKRRLSVVYVEAGSGSCG